jgi:hypothetical protein
LFDKTEIDATVKGGTMKNTASGIRILIALVLCAMLAPAAFAEDLEAIEIELPDEFYGGTPLPYWSPNLEPPSYKDRPPFMAPKGTVILSKDKAVTASAAVNAGKLSQITDGDKSYKKSSMVQIAEGLQWIQVDLEDTRNIYAVLIWHFHSNKRVYFDLVAQVSDDPKFEEGVSTIYNNDYDNSAKFGVGKDNEYIENNKGRLIDAKGAKGRYLRIYGQGNTADEFNDFIEVEIWGK